MKINISKLHNETGEAWDITAKIYEDAAADDIEFLRGGGNSLLPPEREVLSDLGEWCGRAIHLQCAGGKDTLSLLQQGAKEVIGSDISKRMITSAKLRSDALNANASWVRCDVLNMPTDFDSTADLVYTGRGALPWVMDLDAWAKVVVRLLKPGGKLFIFEGHPLDWVWDTSADVFEFHPQRNNYFSEQTEGGDRWPAPFIERQEGASLEETPIHERQWTIGQIVNAVIAVGLTIKHFDEYPLHFWDQFPDIPENLLGRLPHTFSLLAEKS